ncbi:MAG: hypothetical protein GTN78_21530 [Gemmatimonadales bacterium]|nr:hypothetical protein [Gemmatimonadales bacterium]
MRSSVVIDEEHALAVAAPLDDVMRRTWEDDPSDIRHDRSIPQLTKNR